MIRSRTSVLASLIASFLVVRTAVLVALSTVERELREDRGGLTARRAEGTATRCACICMVAVVVLVRQEASHGEPQEPLKAALNANGFKNLCGLSICQADLAADCYSALVTHQIQLSRLYLHSLRYWCKRSGTLMPQGSTRRRQKQLVRCSQALCTSAAKNVLR